MPVVTYNPFTRNYDFIGSTSTSSGVSDHGLLNGLLDDDHPQYLLTDGSRQLSADWDFGAFTISGTGDVHCNDLYTSGSGIYIGGLHLTYDGNEFIIPDDVFVDNSNLMVNGVIGTDTSFFFLSSSGIIGVSGMPDLLELNQNEIIINGDFIFDSNTISGTGDIHCNDLYTAGSGIYLGGLHLTYDGNELNIPENVFIDKDAYCENLFTNNNLFVSGSIDTNNIEFNGTISGTGDIYCNNLYTSSGSLYIGDLHLSYNGSHLVIPEQLQVMGDIGTGNNLYVVGDVVFGTSFGTIGVQGMEDLIEIDQDKMTLNGDVEIGDMNAYYLGEATASGTWRIIRDGEDLKFQWYDGGSWNDGNVTVNR